MENIPKDNLDLKPEKIKEGVEILPIGLTYSFRLPVVVFLIIKDKECYLIGNDGLSKLNEDLWQITSDAHDEHQREFFTQLSKILEERQLDKPTILSSERYGYDYILNNFPENFSEELREEAEKYLKAKGLWERTVWEQDRRKSQAAQGNIVL